MKRLLSFKKKLAVIRKGETGTVVHKDPNLHHAQILSLDFRTSETATNAIVIVFFSPWRVSCTLLFIIDIMRE